MTAAVEQSFVLRGLAFRIQRWGASGLPVMALHGWLDNSESFAPLAACLPGVQLAAPDLAGHGASAHRPLPAGYNLWDDLPDVTALADALGWSRFALLGHSRGAMLALLLAASLPERITRVVFLDGLWPLPVPPADAPQQLGRFLRDSARPLRAARVYPDLAAAVAARQVQTNLPAAVLQPLVARNLRAVAGGFGWRTDPRLHQASAFKLGMEHNRAFLAALRCPARLLLAEQGMGCCSDWLQEVAAAGLEAQVLAGGHHLHMAQPAAVAARLADFLAADAV